MRCEKGKKMEEEDYYRILGVGKRASKEEIKKAYKDLARKHHPDKGGDPDMFKKIAGAYGVLEDDQKRSMYDQFGKEAMEGMGGGGAGGPSDIFSMFHGFGFPERMRKKTTRDRLLDLDVTMEEAYRGVTVKFRFKRKVFMAGETPMTCSMCHGKGRIAERMTSSMGIIQNIRLCTTCAGMGTMMDEKQFQTIAEIMDVVVPPHCHEGFQKVIPGKADEIPDHETGNLVIQIKIKKHPVFEMVEGNHLLWKVVIHPLEALTSFTKTVRLPSGEDLSIRHAAGTPFFSTLHADHIIERKGMFDPMQNRGQLRVRFLLDDFSFSESQKADLFRMAGLSPPPSSVSTITAIPIESLPCSSSSSTFTSSRTHQPPPHMHPGMMPGVMPGMDPGMHAESVQECRPS